MLPKTPKHTGSRTNGFDHPTSLQAENGRFLFMEIMQDLPTSTHLKSNIDTKELPYFKGVHLFQSIILRIQPLVFGDVRVPNPSWNKASSRDYKPPFSLDYAFLEPYISKVALRGSLKLISRKAGEIKTCIIQWSLPILKQEHPYRNDVTSKSPKAEFRKSRSFWSCFEAQKHHSFGGWKSHTWILWDMLVRSFWKDLNHHPKDPKKSAHQCKILDLLGRKSHISTNYSDRKSTVGWTCHWQQIKSFITPTPPNSTPLLPHTQPSLSPIIIPLPTIQLNSCVGFRSFEALLGINANTEAIQSACLARKVFRVKGCHGL